jgi:amino acid transporter
MWYLITGLVCVFLIWNSNKNRNAKIGKYVILSILLPPIGYGLWQAERPLINDEQRFGGKGWNLMKWIGIIHTIMCVIWAFYGMSVGAEVANQADSDAGKVGAAIGTGLGIMMIMMVWFFGIVGSLILGLILKKPITETAQQ